MGNQNGCIGGDLTDAPLSRGTVQCPSSLIHSPIASTAFVSTTFLASGGIWILPTWLTRAYKTDLARFPGLTTRAEGSPMELASCQFTSLWRGSGVVKRASKYPATLRARWHCAQLASKYERTRYSMG